MPTIPWKWQLAGQRSRFINRYAMRFLIVVIRPFSSAKTSIKRTTATGMKTEYDLTSLYRATFWRTRFTVPRWSWPIQHRHPARLNCWFRFRLAQSPVLALRKRGRSRWTWPRSAPKRLTTRFTFQQRVISSTIQLMFRLTKKSLRSLMPRLSKSLTDLLKWTRLRGSSFRKTELKTRSSSISTRKMFCGWI